MKKFCISLLFVALFGAMTISCHQKTSTLASEQDSLSYVIGLSVGTSLIKMDSTLNVDAVCQAIRDVYESKQKMSMEDAPRPWWENPRRGGQNTVGRPGQSDGTALQLEDDKMFHCPD